MRTTQLAYSTHTFFVTCLYILTNLSSFLLALPLPSLLRLLIPHYLLLLLPSDFASPETRSRKESSPRSPSACFGVSALQEAMDLECQDEFLGASHDRHSQIAKGKRTKRQRPASPSGGTASMTSCSSSGGRGDSSSALSPSSSGNNIVYSSAEEEEEDMANCLILLAQGVGRPRQADCDHDDSKTGIFSSKKFSEVVATAAAGGGTSAVATTRAGLYVYECKTCSRVFPSFQALGGHRASHKKPKFMADPDQKIKPSAVVLGLDANEEEDEGHSGKISPPLSVHMASHKGLHQGNKPKIHECNICGSEFTSGQALGGHMRRHRSAPAAATTVDAMSLTDVPTASIVLGGEKSRNVLSLDLNLPAPPEDDHHHQAHRRRDTPKFQFATSQQPIILASPALVDCHN